MSRPSSRGWRSRTVSSPVSSSVTPLVRFGSAGTQRVPLLVVENSRETFGELSPLFLNSLTIERYPRRVDYARLVENLDVVVHG